MISLSISSPIILFRGNGFNFHGGWDWSHPSSVLIPSMSIILSPSMPVGTRWLTWPGCARRGLISTLEGFWLRWRPIQWEGRRWGRVCPSLGLLWFPYTLKSLPQVAFWGNLSSRSGFHRTMATTCINHGYSVMVVMLTFSVVSYPGISSTNIHLTCVHKLATLNSSFFHEKTSSSSGQEILPRAGKT